MLSSLTSLTTMIKLISKFMTSQPGQKTMAIHILPNISGSKSNQAMKLGQSIDYNKRNIFLQKLCRKWDRETSSRPLFLCLICLIWGKSKWSVTLLYTVTTIHWTDKIYCSFVLIYWSQLFICYQNLSLILITKEIFISWQKSYQENG